MEASRAFADPPGEPPRRIAAVIRHSLLALIDLSRALSRAKDIYGAVDGLLLNLMGQFGAPRAAIWLEAAQNLPILIRCHGIERPAANGFVSEGWKDLTQALDEDPRPVAIGEIEERLGRRAWLRARAAGLGLVAPICSEAGVFGLLALGPRADHHEYDALDLEMVGASLAVAGVALENARLNGQAQESNRRLRIANDELRELDRVQSEFASNVGHELRTPLAVMLACLDCLKDYNLAAEENRVLVTRAKTSATRLAEQVEGLLTLAQAGNKSLSLELTEVDLAEFLELYHTERRPGISAGLRELHVGHRVTNARARCDARRLRQVLDELVDNAVKFSPEGSHIEFSIAHHSEEGRPWLKIDIEDDGPGIPDTWLPHVFEKFRQVDGSTTRTVGGMGIGLATAKSLAEAMGGRLAVQNHPGRGSVFSLLLPPA